MASNSSHITNAPSNPSISPAPTRASFLRIPSELRQNILECLFSQSFVAFNSQRSSERMINAHLETSILRVCTTLHREGQRLLASATTIFLHDPYYVPGWPDNAAAAKVYLPWVRTMSLSFDMIFNSYFDGRTLPSLTLLDVHQNREVTTVPRVTINEAKWHSILRGDSDETTLIRDWHEWAFETRRENLEQYCSDGREAPWLFDLIDRKITVPFRVIMHCRTVNHYTIHDSEKPAEEDRALEVAVNFDIETYEVVFRHVVEAGERVDWGARNQCFWEMIKNDTPLYSHEVEGRMPASCLQGWHSREPLTIVDSEWAESSSWDYGLIDGE